MNILSSSPSHGNVSVDIVTHWHQEQGILVIWVPQKMWFGPNASLIRRGRPNVPFEELYFSVAFVSDFLGGDRPAREIMFGISE
jgi:hypothetical protein